jgi:hypothetical protein
VQRSAFAGILRGQNRESAGVWGKVFAGSLIEVLTRPLDEIPAVIAAGGIDYAFVICAFWRAFHRIILDSEVDACPKPP